MQRILSKLFSAPEEINGHENNETYLYRWILVTAKKFSVYLHHFVGDDWSRDLHDHPKRFISIGLWGSYIEETPSGKHVFNAPWIRSFPAEHIHRLTVPSKSCWTLVIVMKKTREWGFWNNGVWVHWREYVFGEKWEDVAHDDDYEQIRGQ